MADTRYDVIALVLHPGQRLAALSVRTAIDGSSWMHAGSAEVRPDGSLMVVLDFLPVDGRILLRPPAEGASL